MKFGNTATLCKSHLTEGKGLAASFTHTVVDAGGRDSAGLRSSSLLAQFAIILIGASNLDATAITDLFEIVELVKEYDATLDVRVLLTPVDPRTEDVGDMLDFLPKKKRTVLATRVCERVAYRRAIVREFGKDAATNLCHLTHGRLLCGSF